MDFNRDQQDSSEISPSLWMALRNKYQFLKMRGTRLWEETLSFSRWFELEASHLATKKSQDEIWIDLDVQGNVQRLWIGAIEKDETLLQYHTLWRFLVSLGIHKLCLDPRLEMNQIQDVFVFLKGQEKALRIRENIHKKTLSSDFLEGKNIHFSCENVVLKENVLIVKYSYCTLKYSQLVHWLKKRNKSFHDHRSLFKMAPRYGSIIAGIILLPEIILAVLHNEWLIFWLLLAAALSLYGIAYLFFMVIGSVEYDNEENIYRLSRAYEKLKFYTSRIQADIKRAQTIQQCFLPNTKTMPMTDSVDWACSFEPADEVGGDFFDVQHFTDDRVVIIFGDVCGHGMAAALVTAVLKTTFQDWLRAPSSLEKLAKQLNHNVCLTTPTGDFAAVFLATLNGRTGQMEYINCGHNPEPWLYHSITPEMQKLNKASCMILGIEEDMDITKATITVQSGDGVFIVSDGITENQDIEGNLYGEQRFEQLLLDNSALSISEIAQLINEESESFSKGASIKDDQSLLAFRIK